MTHNTKLSLSPDGADFARTSDGVALIGDPRNDENLLLNQLHLAFIKFRALPASSRNPRCADLHRGLALGSEIPAPGMASVGVGAVVAGWCPGQLVGRWWCRPSTAESRRWPAKAGRRVVSHA
jgi:hypothetical protein